MPSLKQKIILLLLALSYITPSYAASHQNNSIAATTFSILSYSRLSNLSNICIISNEALATQFKIHSQQNNLHYQIYSINTNELASTSCQAIIFSSLTAQEEQHLLNTTVRYPALSISTNNLNCEIGSAFCLYKKNKHLSFKINLESLSQSKVHIDPRVLLLAKPSEQQ